MAISLAQVQSMTNYYKCLNNMAVHNGPFTVSQHDQVVENMVIIVDPTSDEDLSNDTALSIVNKKNVVIRNVVIYHAANGRGINAWKSKNLTIENVQVIAYGNEKGA
jgi:exosome complex RNA-binding protein Rrp42 (RNase PH superfamily)